MTLVAAWEPELPARNETAGNTDVLSAVFLALEPVCDLAAKSLGRCSHARNAIAAVSGLLSL